MSETNLMVDVVRGRVDGELSERIVSFWSSVGVGGDAMRERLSKVVCVLRGPGGEVVGVNSVVPQRVRMVGNRNFWIYRATLGAPVGDGDYFRMLAACFEELAREFASTGTGPVGVCLMVADEALLERHPQAVWPDAGFLYAGFLPDGAQLRIRYFEDARI